MSETRTTQLASLIARRHELLGQLHQLGQRQWEYIVGEQMTLLMTVLAAKHRILGDLQTVEHGLDPFRKQDPATRQWSAPAERERCAALAIDCERLLAQVVEQEHRSEQEMSRRRDHTLTRLQELSAGRATRGAYVDQSGPVISQLDLSSGT